MLNIKQKLTKNGVELSKICLGTWKISQESYNSSFMANLIEKAILAGITTIDTADIYGNYKTEELIGDSIKNLKIERDKFQIVTKCNIVKNHPDFSNIKSMIINK
jgi:predicted oxidoreductase